MITVNVAYNIVLDSDMAGDRFGVRWVKGNSRFDPRELWGLFIKTLDVSSPHPPRNCEKLHGGS